MISGGSVADIIVVGAGPAGIAAATSAARAGRSVVLLDEGARPGGQIWRHRERSTLPSHALQRIEDLDAAGVRMRFGAAVVDIDAGAKRVFVEGDGTVVSFRAVRAIILCTGARERFLPFPGWTLPGVMGVGGAQALLKQGMLVRGRRVVIAGSGPLLLPVAASLARAGARIVLVAEQASLPRVRRFAAGLWRTPSRVLDAVSYRAAFAPAPYRFDSWVAAAEGEDRVRAVRVTGAGRGGDRTHECDLLCVGFGLVPAVELPRVAGCSVRGGVVQVDELQQTTVPDILCAGEPTGIAGMHAAVAQGEVAGITAAGADVARSTLRRRDRLQRFAAALDRTFALRDELRSLAAPDTIVCRCEDVELERLAHCAGFREARLHTRAGMGPCQGRVCGAALEFMKGWTDASVRPPISPVPVGSLAADAATSVQDS